MVPSPLLAFVALVHGGRLMTYATPLSTGGNS